MEIPIRQEERYLEETLTVIGHLGENRLNELQVALADHSPDGVMPSATGLIDSMVAKHAQTDKSDLGEIGYATIADALSEIGTSKNAIKKLLKGKMGIQKAVDAHRQRAIQASATTDRQVLKELGIAGTPIIYVDEPTDLHLVHLATPEHCRYEGVSLVHCLGNLATAASYLSRGALLYSLREGGTEPRVTIEVNAKESAVTQARKRNNEPLHEDSSEYHALGRALVPLATHVAAISPTQLTITDHVIRC